MRIAKKFLCPFLLMVFLVIPSLAYADTYYQVRPGDNLWNISRSYGTSVDTIKSLNSLKSDAIFPGQSLLVSKEIAERPNVPVSRGTNRPGSLFEFAKSFVGAPYRYGGQSPRGFDCSGYIQYVFSHFEIYLPRT
ncbi:MAG: C40 family peptidase, partial [Desulfocucumaceae bacterium]